MSTEPGNTDTATPEYRSRVAAQIAQYQNVDDMNVMSGAWHRWQSRHFLPRFTSVMGAASPFALYVDTFAKAIRRTGTARLLSIGFGDARIEAKIAKELGSLGVDGLRFDAVEISAAQVDRGRATAERSGVAGAFRFIEADVNTWEAQGPYAGVMVHHALHHMQGLEHFFRMVRRNLAPGGSFVTFDVVGRNGHMRWPETLEVVESLWEMLPREKRRHHVLRTVDERFVNRDCSSQGFEGIRAQDILPLLVGNFSFERFLAWGGLTDVFVSRGFGPNLDMQDPRDVAFLDHVALLNDLLIDCGRIKPTVIAAVMHTGPQGDCRVHRHWTPAFCVRPADARPQGPSSPDPLGAQQREVSGTASWHIAAPLRAAQRGIAAFGRAPAASRRAAIGALRAAYRAFPADSLAKQRLRESIYAACPWPFRSLPSYQLWARMREAASEGSRQETAIATVHPDTRIAGASAASPATVPGEGMENAHRRFLPHIGEILHHEVNVDGKLLETTDWYYSLLEGVVKRHPELRAYGEPRYLELACYRHVLGYRLAKEHGFRSTQFDICANDLAQGRALALQHGFPDEVELVAGDYHSLPFRDGAFDLVFISAAIHHTRTPERVIGEAMRVLRDGGLFYCQREPASREFCFYQFTCNRQANYTPFERHLAARQMLRVISSPFPGARNAILFGRVENDRIALDDYYRAFEPWGTVVEEVLYHEGLLTPFDKEILAHVAAGHGDLQDFIEQRLLAELDLARPLLGERDRSLGYSLPSAAEARDLAERTARSLLALPRDHASREWKAGMARIFGASLRFVVRRERGSRKADGRIHARSLEKDGPVLTDTEVRDRSGIEFWRPLLRSIQDPASTGWERMFPVDAWDHSTGPAKVGDSEARVRKISSRGPDSPLVVDAPERCLLAIRAWCMLPAGQMSATCDLVGDDGTMLCTNRFPQSEDQAILAVLPPGKHSLKFRVRDPANPANPSRARLEIAVCQLLPLSDQSRRGATAAR